MSFYVVAVFVFLLLDIVLLLYFLYCLGSKKTVYTNRLPENRYKYNSTSTGEFVVNVGDNGTYKVKYKNKNIRKERIINKVKEFEERVVRSIYLVKSKVF